ncbi:MAG: ABC transporter ATP-binding protein [Oscillospiraceae bacterium]|nr:ABC transporter ATP-binding protein [Oscillospiraceae bacterium]
MDILIAENLHRTYMDLGVPVSAVNGVSLTVAEGSFTAVIGKSGSGKTTLLRLLSGLDRPDAGSVQIDGQELEKMSRREQAAFRRRRIGFVFQDYSLLPELTAGENILLPLLLDGRKGDEVRLRELASLLGIETALNRRPRQLSGGEQQRTAIARALVANPAVVFADEPTGNLDAAAGQDVVTLLHASQRALGQTVVLVTHDMDLARTADRILTLSDGKIVSEEVGTL